MKIFNFRKGNKLESIISNKSNTIIKKITDLIKEILAVESIEGIEKEELTELKAKAINYLTNFINGLIDNPNCERYSIGSYNPLLNAYFAMRKDNQSGQEKISLVVRQEDNMAYHFYFFKAEDILSSLSTIEKVNAKHEQNNNNIMKKEL